MHPLVVFTVATLHYVLRCTAFIEPTAAAAHRRVFAGEPTWPACAVLLSICMLLIDATPDWYFYRCRLGRVARVGVDFWATMVAIEFAMITIWSRLELLLSVVVWRTLSDLDTFIIEWTDANVDQVAALVIGAVAAAVLLNATRVTDSWRKLSDIACEANDSFGAWCKDRQKRKLMQRCCGDGASKTIKPEGQSGEATAAEAAGSCSYREQHPTRSRNKKKICLMCSDCE